MQEIIAGFLRGLLALDRHWQLWVAVLVVVNVVAPLAFLHTVEAWAVLAAILLAAAIMVAIFRALGFVRLLGLGHLVAWPPLLVWLAARLPEIGPGSFRLWIVSVLVVNSISLVIDLVDVVRYARGERTPLTAR